MKYATCNPDELFSRYSYNPMTGEFIHLTNAGKDYLGKVAGSKDKRGYIRLAVDNNKHIQAHRAAFVYTEGRWPHEQVDHKNRNPSDNSWDNIRDSTNSTNRQNIGVQANNTTGFTGVHFVRGRFIARIGINKTKVYLGSFETAEQAAEAYKIAKKKYHSF